MIGIPVKLYYMHVYEQSKTYGALNKNGCSENAGRGADCGVNKTEKNKKGKKQMAKYLKRQLRNAKQKKNTKIKRELNI